MMNPISSSSHENNHRTETRILNILDSNPRSILGMDYDACDMDDAINNERHHNSYTSSHSEIDRSASSSGLINIAEAEREIVEYVSSVNLNEVDMIDDTNNSTI